MSQRLARMRAVVVGVVTGVVTTAVVPIAHAVNPATGLTSVGQSLDVVITTPSAGSRLPLADGPVTVTGTASIGTTTSSTLAAYVVDHSGSTSVLTATRDCDGNGTGGQASDDVNGDGARGTILDCELSGVMALNDSLATRANTNVSYIAFGSQAALADHDPGTVDASTTTPSADAQPNGVQDMDEVITSARDGNQSYGLLRFTPRSLSGGWTNYNAAMDRMASLFSTFSGQKVAYFVSDGEPNLGNGDTLSAFDPNRASLMSLAHQGVRVHTYSVSVSGPGCSSTSALAILAQRTGGTCTVVSDPTALLAAVSQPATIDHVELRVGTGPVVTATYDAATGAWSGEVALAAGTSTIAATVVASDGTRVTSTIAVTGTTRPTGFIADASGTEGETIQLAASSEDLDGDALTYSWSPSTGLSDPTVEDPQFTAAENGTYPLTLTITDADGNDFVTTRDVVVANAAPVPGAITFTPPQPNEGATVELALPFTDAGSADTHTATIDWGDGTSQAAMVEQGAGSGTVRGQHLYADGGSHLVTVIVTDDDGGTAHTSAHLEVNSAPEIAAGNHVMLEGQAPTTLATSVIDPEGDTTSVAWSPGTRLSATDVVSPVYQVPADDHVDEYTITATDARGATAATTLTVSTLNVAPSGSATFAAGRVGQLRPATLDVAMNDAGVADAITLAVDWGDGTPAEVAGPFPANSSTQLTHSYAVAGTYTPQVTLTDDDGGVTLVTAASIVVDSAPIVDAGGPYTITEGTIGQLNGTVVDDSPEGVSYLWTGSSRLLDVTDEDARFDALDDGNFAVFLIAADPYNDPVTDNTLVTVTNAPPAVDAATANPASAPTGTTVTVTATASDAGPSDTHTALVDWGDGTVTPAAVTGDASGASVSGSHIYRRAGVYTITVEVTDDDGGTGTATTTHEAINTPPEVSAGPDQTVAEGSSVQLQGTATDADGDALTYTWTPADKLSGADSTTPTFTGVDDGVDTLTFTATDPYDASDSDDVVVTTTNVPPTITSLAMPVDPVRLGTAVTLEAGAADPGVLDTHTAHIDWGDGTSENAGVTGGQLAIQHTYATPGVYAVTLTVSDDDGGSATQRFEYVTVFDPEGGFVTGGGSIDSPPGAYTPDPSAAGRATFGFVSKYAKGATTPTGSTEFQLRSGGFTFKSTSYDVLVVSGEKATYRGTGTINGAGEYAFQLSAVDGDASGAKKPDTFRLRVWDRATGGIVYDNEMGRDANGDPTTALTGGSITVHKG